ncbi:hypothetical protein [Nakamurella aerolata]|uniref:Uncharacterized protein n=1 Tax=Nakamurella aerolata TaxID=1656892 RepID=A0A849A7M3_9ACTN|nr:hypothetical protein [Nakamurella aerolata]NNG36027.1 hypothetical protein [Nakamurella aerolata]
MTADAPDPKRPLPDPELPWWRLLVIPGLAAVAIGIALWAAGVPVPRLIGIAVTIGIVTWLLVRGATLNQHLWPEEPTVGPGWDRSSRIWEQPGLDAALDRPQFMAGRLLRTLRQESDALLIRRGLDPESDEARELLGPRTFQLLYADEAPVAQRAELRAIIARLTQLAATPQPGVPALQIPARLTARPARRFPSFGPRQQ